MHACVSMREKEKCVCVCMCVSVCVGVCVLDHWEQLIPRGLSTANADIHEEPEILLTTKESALGPS